MIVNPASEFQLSFIGVALLYFCSLCCIACPVEKPHCFEGLGL